MAGRKPRRTRDEQAGVTPLHGQRAGSPDPRSGVDPVTGEWTPQEGAWTRRGQQQRPPFEPGHKINLDHGLYKGNHCGYADQQELDDPDLEEYARALVSAILEDPAMPDHLRTPVFRQALVNWSRAQALADAWFSKMAKMGLDEMMEPRGKTAQGKSAAEIYLLFHTRAERAAARLGMDPVAYARIVKDLGIERKAREQALENLDQAGAEIVMRRAAIASAKAASEPLVRQDRLR